MDRMRQQQQPKKKKKRNHIHENLFGTSITPRVWILRFERIQIKVLFRPQLHHAQFPPPWVSGIFLEWWSNILKRFRGSCWTWPPRDQWPSCASGGKIKLPRTHTRQTRRGAKTERRDRCGDTHRGRHGGRKQPGWAIIVCYQALPYITDHPSLRCTSAAVPLNPRGNPPLPVQITLHRAQGSDVAQIESVQTPAHNHTDQLSAGPVLWSPRYERIFLNALYIPWLLPPHMLLSFIWGFLRGEGGGSAKYAVGCDKLLWRDARSVSSGFTSGQKVLVCSGGSWEELIKVRAEGWWADCSS